MRIGSLAALHRLVALTVLLPAARAGAQSVGSTVGGVVTDSLARRPLADAVVQLVSADSVGRFGASATSDSLGRFSFAAVPRGRYMLGFFHPLLDSLGLGPPLRELRVDRDGATLRVDVGVPGPARLEATICGAKTIRDSTLSVIVGTVRQAADGAPLGDATVAAEWLEYSLGAGGVSRRIGRLTATTGDNGWFALCGVPSAGSVMLQATRGADSTDRFELPMPDVGFARRDLYVGRARWVQAADTLETGDMLERRVVRRRTGDVRMSGVVVAVVGRKPLAGARVEVLNGPEAIANDRGEWTIPDAPPGTRRIEVRAVGYYPERIAVDVVAGAPPMRTALKTLEAVLDTVRITASRLGSGAPAEFLQRRRSSAGRFITAEDLKHRLAVTTSDIFKNQAGVELVKHPDGTRHLRMRSMFSQSPLNAADYDPYCEPTVFLDGHELEQLSIDEISTMVHPDDITGIEIYDESTVPPQYQDFYRGFPCGSVVIWTKSHLDP